MTQLFRAMKEDEAGLPEIGPNARALGVRPGIDVAAISPGDLVTPGAGGLSVSRGDPMGLPAWRRPPEYCGVGKDPVWSVSENDLGPKLHYRPDPAKSNHGFVEPLEASTLERFQQALGDTQRFWKRETADRAQGRQSNAT